MPSFTLPTICCKYYYRLQTNWVFLTKTKGRIIRCSRNLSESWLPAATKIEAKFSSEASVHLERTTRRYCPEDGTLIFMLYVIFVLSEPHTGSRRFVKISLCVKKVGFKSSTPNSLFFKVAEPWHTHKQEWYLKFVTINLNIFKINLKKKLAGGLSIAIHFHFKFLQTAITFLPCSCS
jgi:hypothetical protein